jgi:hypothetical protein
MVAALVAVVLDFAIPFLPIFGETRFSWSTLPSMVADRAPATMIRAWSTTFAILFAILMLRRHRSAVAAGAFAATAFVVAGRVIAFLVRDLGGFLHVWDSQLVVALGVIETIALITASALTMRRWS